ncbi:MAG: hypothetical protein ABIO70_36020 [Pseudomonadota bacterium]
MLRSTSALFLLLAACQGGMPLDRLDAQYADIVARRNAADRDVARNIHNRDARRRLKDAEKAELAWFLDAEVTAAIEAGLAQPEGSWERVRAEAYQRRAVYARSWKAEEKERETELLAKLDAASGAEATWSTPDGKVEVSLSGRWASVSKAADDLDPGTRADLAQDYVDHQMAVVGDDLRELIKLRNQVARRAGYDDFWQLALAAEGLTEADVDALFREVEPVIRPVNEAWASIVAAKAAELGVADDFANGRWLRRRAGLEAGRDEAEPYFDTDLAEDHVTASLRRMGIELEGWEIFTGPSRNTRRGAYSFPIRPPRNISLVVSQDRRFDIWQYEAVMHEAAHALRWSSLDGDVLASPVLWDPPNAYTEGFAQLFERLLVSEAWLTACQPELPASDRQALVDWRARQMSQWVSEAIVETEVERRMYRDPTSWEAVARTCVEREAAWGLAAGEAPVSSAGVPYCQALHTPLMWHYPGYVQNYIYSYVTEARLYDALVKAVGEPVDNPATGPWLVEHILRPGGSEPFEQRLGAISVAEPRTAALARYVRAPVAAAP